MNRKLISTLYNHEAARIMFQLNVAWLTCKFIYLLILISDNCNTRHPNMHGLHQSYGYQLIDKPIQETGVVVT